MDANYPAAPIDANDTSATTAITKSTSFLATSLSDGIFQDLFGDDDEELAPPSASDQLKLYLADKARYPLSADPLELWKNSDLGARFPLLARAAREFLSLPGKFLSRLCK